MSHVGDFSVRPPQPIFDAPKALTRTLEEKED